MPQYLYTPDPNGQLVHPPRVRGHVETFAPGDVVELSEGWAAELNRQLPGANGKPALSRVEASLSVSGARVDEAPASTRRVPRKKGKG